MTRRAASLAPLRSQAELTAVRTALVGILGCQDDDLCLCYTPEGLIELKLQRLDAATPRETVLRIGTADELQAWAQARMRLLRRVGQRTVRRRAPEPGKPSP
ncbi:hypothetical protein [Thiomonas sp. X19]|uniref:hypothetical protein n=1 Tax=Thiomonas sp. X19 TaxID=1050370 RepID=UPI0011BF84E4|nr:hypothetical protein [Thiomonas sp. X19]